MLSPAGSVMGTLGKTQPKNTRMTVLYPRKSKYMLPHIWRTWSQARHRSKMHLAF